MYSKKSIRSQHYTPASPPKSPSRSPVPSPPLSRRGSFEIDPVTNAIVPISRAASVASKAILSESDDSNDLYIPRNKNRSITSLDLTVEKRNKTNQKSPSPSPPPSPKASKQDDKKVVEIDHDSRSLSGSDSPKRKTKALKGIGKTLERRTYYQGNPKLQKKLMKKK